MSRQVYLPNREGTYDLVLPSACPLTHIPSFIQPPFSAAPIFPFAFSALSFSAGSGKDVPGGSFGLWLVLWWSLFERQVSLELKETDFVMVDYWVLSDNLNHFVTVGAGDMLCSVGGCHFYRRMHCTIKNGSIGTASYQMAMIMSCWLTVGGMVGVGLEGLVADISLRKTFR